MEQPNPTVGAVIVALEQMGLAVAPVSDSGSVRFNRNGITFAAIARTRDPSIVTVTASVWPEPLLGEGPELAAAINELNRRGQALITIADEAEHPGLLSVRAEFFAAKPACVPTVDHLTSALPTVIDMVIDSVARLSDEVMLRGIAAATSESETPGQAEAAPMERN